MCLSNNLTNGATSPTDQQEQQQQQHGQPHNSPWIVNDEDLMPLPTYYPLQRSSKTFKGISARTLSVRISEFMRLRSISTTKNTNYDGDICSLEASTQSGVKLFLKLWRGKKKASIILETQRLYGNSIEFHEVRRGLVRAAKMETSSSSFSDVKEIEDERRSFVMPFLPNDDDDKLVQFFNFDQSLVISADMLKQRNIETNMLALESLCNLTSDKDDLGGVDGASYAANAIVFGRGCHGERIRRSLICRIFSHTKREEEEDDDDDVHDDFCWWDMLDIDNKDRIRNLSLKVVANALRLVSLDKNLKVSTDDNSTNQLWKSIIPTLVKDLKGAYEHPHNAYFAEKCLVSLLSLDETARREAVEAGLEEALKGAYDYGRVSYRCLEIESLRLMELINADS